MLREIDIEKISEADLKKLCEKETISELRVRQDSLKRYIQNLKLTPLETVEEKIKRKTVLQAKVQIMDDVLRQKVQHENAKKHEAEEKFSDQTAMQQLGNLRYSYEESITTMLQMGTTRVPLNTVAWQKPSSPVIEIHCRSGKVRKLDLRKLPAEWWRNMMQRPFSPLFIIAESSGMSLQGKDVGTWQYPDFEHTNPQKYHSPTVVALMIV